MRRRIITSIAVGTVITCMMAWAARPVVGGLAPNLAVSTWSDWQTAQRGIDVAGPATARFGRSIFADVWQIRPNRGEEARWPSREMIEFVSDDNPLTSRPGKAYRRRLPVPIAIPAPEDSLQWERVDTLLVGWPARAFAGEAWYVDEALEPTLRWTLSLSPVRSQASSQFASIPYRPIWSGLVVNLVFWTFVVFLLLAAPRYVRAWRWRRAGLCDECGHGVMSTTAGIRTCARCGAEAPILARAPERPRPDERDRLARLSTPEMRYQSAYVWLVFFSSLDIMLTWVILRRGGEEVNPIAKQVIGMWGLHGAIAFKFALMLFVIVSCEVIGRKQDRSGRRLSWFAVVISAFPALYSLGLLLDHILLHPPP